jgi:hypothetical protein
MIPESSSFSMSVDRGDDGPIVVSVQGALEIPGNTRLLADCLAGSVLADPTDGGRPGRCHRDR